jgi:hypothetical protein
LGSGTPKATVGRNVELIWLLRGLVPGYRTIGNFRKDNRNALKAANRDFVMLARDLDLLGGDLVAIDGAFFHGDASKASIVTRKRLAEQLAALERDIEAYGAALEANDAAEETKLPPKEPPGSGIAEKLTALLAKRARPKPIWRSWRIAARHSCRARMAMLGC